MPILPAIFPSQKKNRKLIELKAINIIIKVNYGVLSRTSGGFAYKIQNTAVLFARSPLTTYFCPRRPHRTGMYCTVLYVMDVLLYCTSYLLRVDSLCISHNTKMLPYKRPADCLFSTYTLTSKMLPGEAFLFSEGREALLLGGTTSHKTKVHFILVL